MNIKDEYKNFVENYKPFPWEIDKDEIRDLYANQNTFEINYKRFFYVFKKLKEIKNIIKNPSILDVGSYPGNMIKMCEYIFNKYSNFVSIGLDLDQTFISEVKKLNVDCINTEIDPEFPHAKEVKEWNLKNFDICLLLDTVEHLVNPVYCFDNANKSLKIGGYLILTTDNITNFSYILKMLLRGESPNIKFILSSFFYIGNHRPHHREFSKDELFFLLEYSGFKILNHEYFNREQGNYFVVKKKLIKKKKSFNLKVSVKNLFNYIFNLVPHFRNHQILVAQKVKNIEENERFQPTASKKQWLEYRLNSLGY
jgi:2-polyprenyl-3-methyl-5-hydroxy-6-metoxy-1,4-benzoquinol methylase